MSQIVVMGPKDVAAMRKAHRDAEAAYFQAKVGALEFAIDTMAESGEDFTASELAYMTGLTPNEVAAQMAEYGWCRAARAAGINSDTIVHGSRDTEMKFVRVMPDGSINPDQCMTVVRHQRTYGLRANSTKRSYR
jgi:hypothetical protein